MVLVHDKPPYNSHVKLVLGNFLTNTPLKIEKNWINLGDKIKESKYLRVNFKKVKQNKKKKKEQQFKKCK